MRAATRVGCFLLGLTLWVSSIGNSSAQEPSSGEKLFQGLVTPDPINMTTLTIGSAATGPGWIRASANLLIGGEDHFRVWNLEGPWTTTQGRQLRAAVELVFAPSFETAPWTALAQISGGQTLDFWTVFDPMVLKPVPPSFLAMVRDDRGIPSAKDDDQEVLAYWETNLIASQSDPLAFHRAVDKSITRADMINHPSKNRGKVVQIKGRLVRLRQIEPSAMAIQAGVPRLYEGWIITEVYGANPTVVLVSTLPAGIVPNESLDAQVEVEGFFFKRYRYESAGPGPDGTPYRKAPLVIGRSVQFLQPVPIAPSSERQAFASLLPWFLGLVAGTGGLVAALTFWMARRDEIVRNRIRQLQGESIDRFLDSGNHWPDPPVVLSTEENDHRQKRWVTPSEN